MCDWQSSHHRHQKKGGHGGHHGGAWKVAYADFVTAMMALFIVLWLLNTSKQVQEAVGGYFKDPTGTSNKVGTDMEGSGKNFIVNKDNMSKLKEELQRAVRQVPDFDKLKNHIIMTVTNEGLRIELTESDKGTFYDLGSPKLNEDGQGLLKKLAEELGKLPNKIAIEGHTDAKPYAKNSTYGNWELSADRANSARRLMQASGLGENQVTQVRGFGDEMPLLPDAPLDPANRRVSLIVQYLAKPDADTAKPGEPAAPGAAEPGANASGAPAAESKAPDAKVPDAKSSDTNAPPEKAPAAKSP
ncbi:MAG: flagellar motor protein MotB [Candidatus Acidiferrales bacterium]